jgi:hypothetical protein
MHSLGFRKPGENSSNDLNIVRDPNMQIETSIDLKKSQNFDGGKSDTLRNNKKPPVKALPIYAHLTAKAAQSPLI